MRINLPMFDSAPDLIPADAVAGVWTMARGVQFRAGQAERAAPAVPQHDDDMPEEVPPILGLMSMMTAAGEFWWIVASASGVWAVNQEGWNEITPAAWAPGENSILTLHPFNGVAIINDSAVGPFYWGGAVGTPAAPLPGWPTGWRVTAMRSHSGFLFGVGRLDMGGGQRVCWSDAAEAGTLPSVWQPAADNFAGWVDLLPASSPCVDGMELGNDFLVFKGESVHAFTFAGGNDIFSVRKRFTNIGLAGVNGWASGPSERAIFAGSDGDIYVTDGQSLQSALQGKAQRTYYEDADPVHFRYGVAGATLGRVGLSLIAYRRRGEEGMSRAVVFDWASGAISVRTLPNVYCLAEGRALGDAAVNSWDSDAGTWSSDQTVWDYLTVAATADDVMAGADRLYLVSDRTLEPGIVEPVYLLKTAASLGDSETAKLIRRVFPRIKGQRGELVGIRIGASMEAEEDVSWSGRVLYPIGQGAHVDLYQRGRFVSVEVTSEDGSDSVFSVGAIELDAVEAGRW